MGEKLMPSPMTQELHDLLVEKYFEPFHRDVRAALAELRKAGAKPTYHLDAHSMPSVGTKEHRDPGEHRADVVVSDCEGKSCSTWFKDLVIRSYEQAGFRVAYNWPYKGGRVTETYGRPAENQEAIQVEFNRGLYMNETTKKLVPEKLPEVQSKIARAVETIYAALPNL
jgi:N-formylglutamate amidohydrolase